MKKNIVFDVDRTLVDSYQPELISLQEAIEHVLGNPISEEDVKRLTTLPTEEFFKSLNLRPEEIIQINEEWEKTFSNYQTVCFPGIKDLIRKLFLDGYHIHIITSRTMKEYHELDKELEDISRYISVVVTSDLIKHAKPDRESMDYLCDKARCTREEVIYVGDSYIDKEFAKNSGCQFIPACWENTDLIGEDNACFTPNDVLESIVQC